MLRTRSKRAGAGSFRGRALRRRGWFLVGLVFVGQLGFGHRQLGAGGRRLALGGRICGHRVRQFGRVRHVGRAPWAESRRPGPPCRPSARSAGSAMSAGTGAPSRVGIRGRSRSASCSVPTGTPWAGRGGFRIHHLARLTRFGGLMAHCGFSSLFGLLSRCGVPGGSTAWGVLAGPAVGAESSAARPWRPGSPASSAPVSSRPCALRLYGLSSLLSQPSRCGLSRPSRRPNSGLFRLLGLPNLL